MLAAVFCLAQALYFEARSEPVKAQLLVAKVVANRVQSEDFPNTVCGVVYQEGQFSWTTEKLPIEEPKLWGEILRLAVEIQLGTVKLPNSEALYFHSGPKPDDFKELYRLGKVGNHTFYK
jgi:spore germination cell wall hydrolase CwlJ-like protein